MKNLLFSIVSVIAAFNISSQTMAATSITQKKGWDVVLNFLYGQPPFTLAERKELQKILNWPKSCDEIAENFSDKQHSKDSRIIKYNLSDTTFLLQIGCAIGAYQESFVYYFIDDKKETFNLIQFKTVEIEANNKVRIHKTTEVAGIPTFQGGKLTLFEKGRGAGGCGSEITYGFKKAQSYVIRARARSCEEPMDSEGKYADPSNWPLVKIDD